MLKIQYHSNFKKDYKKIKKRACDEKLLLETINLLILNKPLPKKYKEHNLSGNYKGYKECHILPDWLLVYKIDNEKLILVLLRTGSHSNLFK